MRRDVLILVAAVLLLLAACSASPASAPTTSQLPTATTTEPDTNDSAAPVALPLEPAGQAETVTLEVAGVDRVYRLYVPPQVGATPDAPAPLVVDFHGLGSDPDMHNEASRMRQMADVAGFVVAQPAARGGIPAWNGQPDAPGADADVAFVIALIDDVADRHTIDRGAVFASGFSNGGGMVHRLACDASDVFAAVATVSGQYPLVESCDPGRPMAIMSFHGTEDLVVPISGVRRVLPDVTAWIAGWVDRDECAPVPARRTLADDVLIDTWSGCAGGAEVVFITIEDGPHAWPGSSREGFFVPTQSIDATQSIWEFFERHARR